MVSSEGSVSHKHYYPFHYNGMTSMKLLQDLMQYCDQALKIEPFHIEFYISKNCGKLYYIPLLGF